MKIISQKILKNYQKKIINIHPSLLPKFKGLNTYERVIENKEIKTGCTVHFVNKKLDDGNIIVKKSFFLKPNDNESL